MVYPSLEAAEKLANERVQATVINARFVKPLDADLILKAAREHPVIVTVEEAYLMGGFGSAVMELLEANGLQDQVKVVRMGVADEVVTHGDPKVLLAGYGLDVDGIYARVKSALDSGSAEKRLRVVS
jgi:1-deoxy-D-xylulose-5-phosphate synthase